MTVCKVSMHSVDTSILNLYNEGDIYKISLAGKKILNFDTHYKLIKIGIRLKYIGVFFANPGKALNVLQMWHKLTLMLFSCMKHIAETVNNISAHTLDIQ